MNQIQHDDGFNNLNDDLSYSVQRGTNDLGLFSKSTYKSKYTRKTIKIEMEVERPVSLGLRNFIKSFLFDTGATIINKVGDVGKQVPGLIAQGATGLYNKIASTIPSYSNQAVVVERPVYDPSKESLLIVMPEHIIVGGIQIQNQWIEENKNEMHNNIHILCKMPMNINLNDINDNGNNGNNNDDDNSPDPGCDYDVYPVQHNQFDGLESIDNLQALMVSYEDFQLIQSNQVSRISNPQSVILDEPQQNEMILSQQIQQFEQEEEEIKPKKKITLYPFLAKLLTKDEFNEGKNQLQETEQQQKKEQKQSENIQQSNLQEPQNLENFNQFNQTHNPYDILEQSNVKFQPLIKNTQVQKEKVREVYREVEYEYE